MLTSEDRIRESYVSEKSRPVATMYSVSFKTGGGNVVTGMLLGTSQYRLEKALEQSGLVGVRARAIDPVVAAIDEMDRKAHQVRPLGRRRVAVA